MAKVETHVTSCNVFASGHSPVDTGRAITVNRDLPSAVIASVSRVKESEACPPRRGGSAVADFLAAPS